MKIYTTYCQKLTDHAHVEKHKIGYMLVPRWCPTQNMPKVPYAIDNGAFTYSTKGYPFLEGPFMKLLEKSYQVGIKPDFIALPDILGGGNYSLDFSMKYIDRFRGCPNLALVVQDGMEPKDLKLAMGWRFSCISHIFIGGSVKWKWETAPQWKEFCYLHDLKLHIGQCGNLNTMRSALEVGADSIDSANFARNDSWDLLSEFKKQPDQEELSI